MYYLMTMLTSAGILMIAGTGALLSIRCGAMNLGGEGQIYAGGFAGCAVLVYVQGPSPLVFALALAASLASGSLLGLLSALLWEKRGAQPLLTSFIISAAVIPLIDGFISASKNTSATNMLALPYISEVYRKPKISLVLCPLFCIAARLFLYRTYSGRKMSLWGKAPEFASYCGFASSPYTYSSLAVSGALHALAGFTAVCMTYFTCHKGFYLGTGWNALSAALLSSGNPLMLIPSSLFLAWLYTFADRISLMNGFGFDIGGIIQGIVLFAISVFSVRSISQNSSGRRIK